MAKHEVVIRAVYVAYFAVSYLSLAVALLNEANSAGAKES